MNILNAKKRSKGDKLVDVRANGFVPAVVYGAGIPNTVISVPVIQFEKVLRVVGESSTLVLDIEGGKVDVLVHEVQYEAVRGQFLHIDFLAVDMNKPVQVAVQLSFVGVSPAEKGGLGNLVKVLHEVEIEALPKDLPHELEVLIESLVVIDDQIHVKDIVLPQGVKMITNQDEVVVLITEQKEEVQETEPVDLSAIEVEKKGKKNEEEGESSTEEASKKAE